MTKKEKTSRIIEYFQKHMPVAETELHYNNPYELIVAVILSAQCTDKRVNIITPNFFKKFPTPEILALADVDEIFNTIRSCSYPNNKAKNLSAMAKMLVNEYGSQLPDDRDELEKLPGVGRKTANVLASVLFNKQVIAVDTHVFRVGARIGLTTSAKNPIQCEEQLVKLFPGELLPIAHHWLILHGRYICNARSPKCAECGITELCDFYNKKQ